MIYQQLFDQTKQPEVVRSALIGCGHFGSAIVSQARFIPRLELRVVADTNIESARTTFAGIGVDPSDVQVCEGAWQALSAYEAGKWVVVSDAMDLMGLPLHVIATATRVPEASARYAHEAIRHGKHVVFVDKEADSVVGPMLKRLADQAGVVFTTEDGDQPGLVMGLVSWARALGLEVLCAGNFHELDYSPEDGTLIVPWSRQSLPVPSASRWMLERIREGEAPRYATARRRLADSLGLLDHDGDTYAHTVVTANGTGLTPDTPGIHLPLVRLEELPEVLCPIDDGGILHTRGCVEMVTLLRTEGVPSLDGGVFIVVANPDQHARGVMIGKGLMANRARSAMLIYRQHHLCGVETPISMLCAGLLGTPTGASTVRPLADIAATAKRDFRAGDIVSGLGESSTDGNLVASLIPATPLADDGPLPFFLLEGNRLAADWPKGTALTRRMVVPPGDSTLWTLRRQQDEVFLQAGAESG